MQLTIVFEKNNTTGAYYIIGVADNPVSADSIAAISLSKGRMYSAYTESYSYNSSLDRTCYVVYPRNNWIDKSVREKVDPKRIFGKMYYSGDIKIYKTEDSAVKKAATIVDDIVDPGYEHKDDVVGEYVNIRLNDPVY